MTAARLIGYWRLEGTPYRVGGGERWETFRTEKQLEEWWADARAEQSRWPDPRQFVDPTWVSSDRLMVADHLERGTLVNVYRGLSPCRFCGRHNGSAEMTDGAYCWPEGLAHYVRDHEVRLPEEFVTHVRGDHGIRNMTPRPTFDEKGQRDRSWSGSHNGLSNWQPEDGERNDGFACVDSEIVWWLGHADQPPT